MEEQNSNIQNTTNKKMDEILEIVHFLKDNAVHKSEFNELRGEFNGFKSEFSTLKEDFNKHKEEMKVTLGDIQGDISRIRDHVKCLRFASEKTVEILQKKRVINELDEEKIFEAGQFHVATI